MTFETEQFCLAAMLIFLVHPPRASLRLRFFGPQLNRWIGMVSRIGLSAAAAPLAFRGTPEAAR